MNKIPLILILVLSFFRAEAQNTFSNTGSGLNDMSRFMDDRDSSDQAEDEDEYGEEGYPAGNAFADISMDATDSLASFDNIPGKKKIAAHVTDKDGNELLMKSLDNTRNSLDVHRLPRDLFFITLTCGDQRKAFTLDRSEEEKKKKRKQK